MIAHLIRMTAREGMFDELVEFLRWDAEVALADEPGTLRFDVYAVPDDPTSVYLYEMYRDEAAFAAHREAAPFKKFVEHVVPNVIATMDVLLRSATPLASNVPDDAA
jgi:(4S)-4-hydroxy-5-phosphonooxypentane-2,3-dione isomerase